MFKINYLLFCIVFFTPLTSAAYISELPDLGKPQRVYLTQQQEIELGKKMMGMLENSGLIINDPMSAEYINQVGNSLVKNSTDPTGHFQFILLDLPSINAFAGPDGYVFVHSGLLLATDNEDELAGVLAHEIAHVTQGHLARRIAEAKRMRLPYIAGILAASALTVVSGGAASGALAATIAGTEQHQLNYSRSHETEADNVGLDILVKAGYDPNAIAKFFKTLQKKQNSYQEPPELLSSHPLTPNRIAEIENRVAKLQPKSSLKEKSDFAFIQQRLTVLTSNDLHQIEMIAQKKAQNTPDNMPSQYGYILALMANNDHKKAYQQISPLKNENVYMQLAFAISSFESGHQQQSLDFFNQLHEEYPQHYSINTNYAYYLLQAGKPQEAVQLLQRYRLQNPDAKIPYELLARAQAANGDKSAAYQTRADLFLSHHQTENALTQLRAALQHSQDNPPLQKMLQAKIDALTNLE